MTSGPLLDSGERLRHLVEKAIDGKLAPGKNDSEAAELRGLVFALTTANPDWVSRDELVRVLSHFRAYATGYDGTASDLLSCATIIKLPHPVWEKV